MTGNNNMNGKSNGEQEKYPDTDVGVSPVDSSFVQMTDTGTNSLSLQGYIEGSNIKQQFIAKAIKKINQRYITQILLSLLRNVLCWACLVTMIIMASAGSNFPNWHHENIAVVVIIFAMGLLGVGFHAYRAYLDLSFENPTLIAQMLRDAISRDEFTRKIQNRQLSAPEVLIEVRLKSGAMSYDEPNHWTRSGRKKCKELEYRGWADQSPSVQQFKWPESGAAWIIVSKDFRCVDDATKNSLESEVLEFRKDTGYNDNSYFMDLEYILQWKENDSCPDCEFYLVYDDTRAARAGLYNFDLYKASWILALDSLFRIVFHLRTKRMDDYFLIKFIER